MFVPNYEYQCSECANRFELWQNVGEAAPPCPKCGAVTKKVFHPPRVIFKGSGFYVTDLRAEKEAGSSGKSGSSTASTSTPSASSESGNSSSSEAKAESKPESKADGKTESSLSQPASSDKK